ncbi:hypothetical protein CQ14_36210 [Bradyrhizobium lablabi]|uniref:DUF1963 domain-containing protein n=1 Tax=Bradyrhizobium lablabi TaxID=722472 RepID=A0A0R3MJS3_9BRAD|nr:YwqG family protein [Bradyrhizobium lablabi]KRR18117.1 hypothetical protein CQ14_36210 [Bradyrhizobium lablabi]
MRTLFKTAAEIDGSLRAAGVRAADAMALAARSKPYIWLETAEVDDEAEIALGTTKVGGTPDLPATMPWPWRPPYPDHEERVKVAQAGVDFLNPQDMAALQAETLEEVRKLLQSSEFEIFATESAKVDYGNFSFDFLVEDVRRTAEPAPLQFIAQVDLANIWSTGPVDQDIPREGRLLLFYDTDHRPAGDRPADITGARLIHDLTPVDSLKRTTPPAQLSAHKQTTGFRPQRCLLHAGMWPPYFGSPEWNACEIKARAEKTVDAWWYEVTRDGHDHRFGGYPLQIQGDMQTECALVSNGLDLSAWNSKAAERLKSDAANWLLLLQIASDDRAGMMWGDVGNLYVWIHRDALRARRFEEVRVILQCY